MKEAVLDSSIDQAEVDKFARMAEEWWDPKGKFAPLHKMNPLRLAFIRDRMIEHFGCDAQSYEPFKGLQVLDIGSGGGLLSEPFSRLGAEVTGVDASERNIEVARLHAKESGLEIKYRAMTAEALLEEEKRFDVVLAMEIIEHVAEPADFVKSCANLMKPDGMMVMSTLNKTAKSFALGIVAAEYILGWLPKGTHDWRKFVTPEQMDIWVDDAGLDLVEVKGGTYNPITDVWTLGSDTAVNYFALIKNYSDCPPD
jgi:2-polyprenyl-6-hydroxyphenyl methylase / 3-demethylubiquinone-9 3-methyltransferase